MDMRADQMEDLSDAENDAMDQLLQDMDEERQLLQDTDEERQQLLKDMAPEERQVQKRVFSSFNMSHGRSK